MSSAILRDTLMGMLHLVYPRLCEGCANALLPAERILCVGCALQLPETGYHHIPDNETALRFAGRVPFCHATTYAYFVNDGLLQHLLHELKYNHKKQVGYYLGEAFGRSLQNTAWIHEIDLIVPVPLHPAKKASRGYNQAMQIAEGMSSVLNIPAEDGLLQRVRETESQTKKTRIERVNNMAGAFKVRQPARLSNKHILLCDDVLTTGATLEACAQALVPLQNVKISFATIGIAVS